MPRPLGAAIAVAVSLAVVGGGARLTAQRIGRTPDGHPDLQGVWLNDTATPLERPRELGSRSSFTDEEARA